MRHVTLYGRKAGVGGCAGSGVRQHNDTPGAPESKTQSKSKSKTQSKSKSV